MSNIRIKCHKCDKEFNMMDLAYLGSAKVGDLSCPPKSGLIALCYKCIKGTQYVDKEDSKSECTV